MVLAELEIFHSRPIAPTRRVALGHLDLPIDPVPGFGGLLLGGVVAAFMPELDACMETESREDKVVVLVFSADWCAICKTQAPYERFLLERYDKWPFALLGVETGNSREAARLAQSAGAGAHRSWWDASAAGETSGPIAGAWNVTGWPASYVIDGDGVIRFVDLRDEDLLKAVRQLVDAQVDRDAKAKRAR